MKKAFISIYVLIILLISGLAISFIHKQNQVNFQTSLDLYYRKQAMFEAESVLNIIIKNSDGQTIDQVYNSIDKSNFNSSISIHHSKISDDDKVEKIRSCKVLNIKAENHKSCANAILVYKINNQKQIDIVYRLAN